MKLVTSFFSASIIDDDILGLEISLGKLAVICDSADGYVDSIIEHVQGLSKLIGNVHNTVSVVIKHSDKNVRIAPMGAMIFSLSDFDGSDKELTRQATVMLKHWVKSQYELLLHVTNAHITAETERQRRAGKQPRK